MVAIYFTTMSLPFQSLHFLPRHHSLDLFIPFGGTRRACAWVEAGHTSRLVANSLLIHWPHVNICEFATLLKHTSALLSRCSCTFTCYHNAFHAFQHWLSYHCPNAFSFEGPNLQLIPRDIPPLIYYFLFQRLVVHWGPLVWVMLSSNWLLGCCWRTALAMVGSSFYLTQLQTTSNCGTVPQSH